MEQNLKDFLRFGASDRISKKELWKLHAAIFFIEALLVFAMHLMETPLWTQIFLFVIWILCVADLFPAGNSWKTYFLYSRSHGASDGNTVFLVCDFFSLDNFRR